MMMSLLARVACALAMVNVVSAAAHERHPRERPNDRPLLAIDANGRTLGRFFAYGFQAQEAFAARAVNGLAIAVKLAPGPSDWSLLNFSTSTVYFENPQCLGAAYFRGTESEPFGFRPSVIAATGPSTFAIYVAGPSAQQNVAVGSSFFSGQCFTNADALALAWPVAFVDNLGSRFVPPFKVR